MKTTRSIKQRLFGFLALGAAAFSAPALAAPAYTVTDLGIQGGTSSAGMSLEDEDQAEGWASTVDDAASHDFLYDVGSLLDLNNLIAPNPGWPRARAYGITIAGQIVGYGTLGGQAPAFPQTPVPVPAAVWLFGSGLAALGRFGRRRRAQSAA